ncbi:hypothetical protein P4C99_21230 [Pontiellaceae bacterium B1224]|nr:hypothetical protein [Pontiellaceae bacterium B1224]
MTLRNKLRKNSITGLLLSLGLSLGAQRAEAGCNLANSSGQVTITISNFDRIPPSNGTEEASTVVRVTLVPATLPAGESITLSIIKEDGTSGHAQITYPQNCTITQTTDVKIAGTVQSWGGDDKPAANNFKLLTKVTGRSEVCAEQKFTVCAHPKDFSCTGPTSVGLVYGLVVDCEWGSDGYSVNLLDKCGLREYVTYSGNISAPFLNANKAGSTVTIPAPGLDAILGTKGDDGTIDDRHKHYPNMISVPPTVGSYSMNQQYKFECKRCGKSAVLASYIVERVIYDHDESQAVDLYFKTTKTGPGGPFESDEDIIGY